MTMNSDPSSAFCRIYLNPPRSLEVPYCVYYTIGVQRLSVLTCFIIFVFRKRANHFELFQICRTQGFLSFSNRNAFRILLFVFFLTRCYVLRKGLITAVIRDVNRHGEFRHKPWHGMAVPPCPATGRKIFPPPCPALPQNFYKSAIWRISATKF